MKRFDITTKFESGTYYLYDGDTLPVTIEETVHLEEKIYRAIYCSEKTWLDTAIYLKDLYDVTLDFGGATLYLRDDTIQPFVLDGCRNVTIKNVVVEYERSMMDEMDIVDVKDGEIWFKQTEKQKKHFPLKVENGNLIPVAGNREYADAMKEPHFFNLYDKETGLSRSMCLVRIGTELPYIPWETYPFYSFELVAEQRGEYIVMTGNIPPNVMADVTCAQCHAARDLNSCFIIRSQNTRLENFRILNGAGMGILGMYSENITLDGLKLFCDERSHGIATNAADAVHLISCFGKIEIVNSVFESMKDDAINVHGNYYTAKKVEDGVIYAKLNTDIQANPGVNAHYKMFGEGDRIAVYRRNTTLEKQRLIIESIEVIDDFNVVLRVKGDTSSIEDGDSIENLSIQADIHIQNCRFGKALTHLRLQTRGKVLIEDCECALKILLSGDKNYWYEGSPINDLTIKNCRFLTDHASIVACPEFETCPESPHYHSGIKIIGNTFDAVTALNLSHSKNIVFQGNINSRGVPFSNIFNNCDNVVSD